MCVESSQPPRVLVFLGYVGLRGFAFAAFLLSFKAAAEGIEKGQIVFAEAATGTGKGRMIASLAATRAAQGDSVVISAPLAVTWQLLDDLEELEAAWTGVNLSDQNVPAEKDFLLTDLIITRLPLGSNRSLTHERRVKIAGYAIVIQEAAWMLRQGIGRLVRREGLTDRNLWVLDHRMDDPKAWLSSFRRILKPYNR